MLYDADLDGLWTVEADGTWTQRNINNERVKHMLHPINLARALRKQHMKYSEDISVRDAHIKVLEEKVNVLQWEVNRSKSLYYDSLIRYGTPDEPTVVTKDGIV